MSVMSSCSRCRERLVLKIKVGYVLNPDVDGTGETLRLLGLVGSVIRPAFDVLNVPRSVTGKRTVPVGYVWSGRQLSGRREAEIGLRALARIPDGRPPRPCRTAARRIGHRPGRGGQFGKLESASVDGLLVPFGCCCELVGEGQR